MSNQHEGEIIAPNLLIHLELHTFTSSIPIKAFVGGAKNNFEHFKHTKFVNVCRLIFFYIFLCQFLDEIWPIIFEGEIKLHFRYYVLHQIYDLKIFRSR